MVGASFLSAMGISRSVSPAVAERKRKIRRDGMICLTILYHSNFEGTLLTLFVAERFLNKELYTRFFFCLSVTELVKNS